MALVVALIIALSCAAAASTPACAPQDIPRYLEFVVVRNSFNYSSLPLVTSREFWHNTSRVSSGSMKAVQQFGAGAVYATVDDLRGASTAVAIPGADEGVWKFKIGNPCGFEPTEPVFARTARPFDELGESLKLFFASTQPSAATFAVDEEVRRRRGWIEDVVRGKNILMVGDSTVRNTFLTLIAMLCNPIHMADCGLTAATLGAYGNDGSDAMSCFAEAARTNRCVPTSANGHDAYVEFELLSFGNLTAKRIYQTRAERKQFWAAGLTPPMSVARMPSINTTIFFLSSSCGQTKDGIFRVLSFVSWETDNTRRDLVKRSLTPGGPKNHTDRLPQLDIIMGSAGPHCLYRHAGYRWFYKLALGIKPLIKPLNAPFVWLEPLQCFKGAPNETSFTFAQGNKATSCSYLHQSMDKVSAVMRSAGHFVAPLRGLSGHMRHYHVSPHGVTTFRRLMADEELWKCVYLDHLHPGVKCNRAINLIVLQTMRLVFGSSKPQRQERQRQPQVVGANAVAEGASQQQQPSHEVRGRQPLAGDDATVVFFVALLAAVALALFAKCRC